MKGKGRMSRRKREEQKSFSHLQTHALKRKERERKKGGKGRTFHISLSPLKKKTGRKVR